MTEELAVEVRDACKSYIKGTVVLNHMNMTVQTGTIYGLLGSSGCGKTSILSCIVGLRQLDSGHIHVFGKRPGSEGSGIPGRRLGYMPQDISLYPHFTISEILLYFGRIYGMPKSDILKRVQFLTTFLQLPNSSKRISSLSGGQQRRTSLATAFVHDPELLILDEPTVGVDPILRTSIWDHLCQMVKTGRTTVIVTTHYTEEARRSDTIGLMRNGRLLAEDSPAKLRTLFDVPLLEDIVLELCRQDHKRMKEENARVTTSSNQIRNGNNNGSGEFPRPVVRVQTGSIPSLISRWTSPKSSNFVAESTGCDCVVVGFQQYPENVSELRSVTVSNHSSSHSCPQPSCKWNQIDRIHSLIRRNCIYFLRNLPFLFMLVIFPALQTAIVATTIGGDPKNMSIAVVNEELPNWKKDCRFEPLDDCHSGHYSCRFLKRLEYDELKLVPFSTKEEALNEIKMGNLHYGILSIPTNYTTHVRDRDVAGNFPFNETIEGTTIGISLDYSNYIASWLILRQLYASLEGYAMKLGKDCGNPPEQFEIPLEYREPVYGRLEAKYTEYVVPGALTMILFVIPMCSCGLAFVADKRQGTMDRSMVAGVSTFEMMLAFSVTDGMMIIAQSLISTAIILFGFDFRIEGSYVLYGMMCLLTGLCGQSWGFVLGLICPDEASLLITGFTIHFPMLVAGGIIWPLEGIPIVIRYLSNCLPVTAAVLSMRSIVARGVGLFSNEVWPGVAILCLWILLAWTVAGLKYKTLRK
ncbi:unnamed protein product [Orchesella dallaii]|uniref:ABC transporter domain-containing protein n=1 Tax=Orchesella dallaii TaxID=48710 RepID=A0ABP1Q6N4_9HEXA